VSAWTAASTPAGAVPGGRGAQPAGIAAGSLRMDPSFADGLSCTGCGGGRMTRILLALTDGTPVDLTSCHSCDYHVWRAGDGTFELDRLLPAQRSHEPAQIHRRRTSPPGGAAAGRPGHEPGQGEREDRRHTGGGQQGLPIPRGLAAASPRG